MSYDSPAILKAFSERMHIEFPMLSDPDSAIIKQFGILNETVPKSTAQYGMPYPGIYILDAKGVITSKFFEDDFRQRDTAGMILLQQFGIAPDAQHSSFTAKHLNITVAPTESNPHMGQHLALVLDATLPRNVHVYAPGVKGYIPIDWQVLDTAALKVGPVTYPPSRLLRLEAIKETVPVYENQFHLTRNITLTNEKDIEPLLDKDGNLTVAGTFRYQACDEEKCFIPETVPVNITLHFQHLDRTRVPENIQHH